MVEPSDQIFSTLLRLVICGKAESGAQELFDQLSREGLPESEDRTSVQAGGIKRSAAAANFGQPHTGFDRDIPCHSYSDGRREFVAAILSGNKQNTLDLLGAAANADAAVLVVEAIAGVSPNAVRQAALLAHFGVRNLIVAVTGMERAGFEQLVFTGIRDTFSDLLGQLPLDKATIVPVSVLQDENVLQSGPQLSWFDGPCLKDLLDSVQLKGNKNGPLRLSVQQAGSGSQSDPGCDCLVDQGSVRPGGSVTSVLTGEMASINRITTPDGEVGQGSAGDRVTLHLDSPHSFSTGEVLADPQNSPAEADQFSVDLVWLSEKPMFPGRLYNVTIGGRTQAGQITELKHLVRFPDLSKIAASHLDIHDLAYCTLSLDRAVPFDSLDSCPALGRFTVSDRSTNDLLGVGAINFDLWRATTIPWQDLEINKAARARQNNQKPVLLWFTGLSGAGKSTVANEISKQLHARGRRSYLMDGDNLRHGLNRDLGFRQEDRVENIRRVGEVAKLFVDAGLIVLASLISPFRSERMMVREMMEPDEFIEIFVDAPLAECERRDPKGLYARARSGEIRNFTGIDSPYEPPENPELVLDTVNARPAELAGTVLRLLEQRGVI